MGTGAWLGAPVIFHIADPAAWAASQADGEYRESTRGKTLAEVGFIHCSYREQVEAVANAFYADWPGDLLLLEIDPSGLDVRVESLGGDEAFPHIYGPLPTTAVRAVHRLRRADHRWLLPA